MIIRVHLKQSRINSLSYNCVISISRFPFLFNGTVTEFAKQVKLKSSNSLARGEFKTVQTFHFCIGWIIKLHFNECSGSKDICFDTDIHFLNLHMPVPLLGHNMITQYYDNGEGKT